MMGMLVFDMSHLDIVRGIFTDERIVRELGNGTWAILGLEVLIAVNWYLYRQWRDRHSFSMPFFQRLPVRMALAINIYMIGSDTRAFWVWILLECQNRTMTMCPEIQRNYFAMHAAVLLAVIGGLYLVRLMTLHWEEKGWRLWVSGGFLAVTIPIVVHVFV